MSKILFAWEMGTGLGHLTRIQPIANQLSELGHQIFLASREVAAAYELFSNPGIPILQAPIDIAPSALTPTSETFAHILYNCGFSDATGIAGRTYAWRHLFDFVQPDLLVADCSPTALLAARCAQIRCVALGTGFECPPDVTPLPTLRRQTKRSVVSDGIEDTVLKNVNRVCEGLGAEPLDRVSQLYYGDHPPLLLTYSQLDCYLSRNEARYWGAVTFSNGRQPIWPLGAGPRVFAYMLEHEFTPVVVRLLADRGWPTIVMGGRETIRAAISQLPSTISISTDRLDSRTVANQCDLTICFGGHGTICVTLLAGKPLLILPTTVEQYLNGIAVTGLRAGELGQVGNEGQVGAMLEKLTSSASYLSAADEFAALYLKEIALPTAGRVAAYLAAASS